MSFWALLFGGNDVSSYGDVSLMAKSIPFLSKKKKKQIGASKAPLIFMAKKNDCNWFEYWRT